MLIAQVETINEDNSDLIKQLSDFLKIVAKEDQTGEVVSFFAEESKSEDFAQLILDDSTKADFLNSFVPEHVYNALRNFLNGKVFGSKKIIAKKGRKGGLRVIEDGVQSELVSLAEISVVQEKIQKIDQDEEKIDQDELTLEKHFYPLVEKWALERGYENCIITGGKIPGFKWENPDLINVDYWFNEITTTIGFDLTAFEVKLRVEPYSVWQAAHYARFSHEVYLAFAKDENEVRTKDDGRVFALAVELGLGVLVFDNQTKRFREIQSPYQLNPAQTLLTETLNNFMSDEKVGKVVAKAKQEHQSVIKKMIGNSLLM